MTTPRPPRTDETNAKILAEAIQRVQAAIDKGTAKSRPRTDTKPQPVEIVRPDHDGVEISVMLAGEVLGLLLAGKSVQFWAKKLFGKEFTYWEGVRLVAAIRALQRPDSYTQWTRRIKR